jgi:hypothetical protein
MLPQQRALLRLLMHNPPKSITFTQQSTPSLAHHRIHQAFQCTFCWSIRSWVMPIPVVLRSELFKGGPVFLDKEICSRESFEFVLKSIADSRKMWRNMTTSHTWCWLESVFGRIDNKCQHLLSLDSHVLPTVHFLLAPTSSRSP